MTHKSIIEAALFISTDPLSLDQIARISGINSLGHLKELLESLQKDYKERGIEIVSTQDGWTMQVRQEMLPKVAHLTPYSDLGEGPKRTLALVTLKEPVRQSEIIKAQGNKAYSYIKDLAKRGLVVSEKQGHTKVLKLTQEFERYFGEERAKIREQLQKHLESLNRVKQPKDKPAHEGEAFDFIEEARKSRDKARTSVAPKKPKLDEEEEDEPEEEEKAAHKEAPSEKPQEKLIKASHDHAFQEID
jgi:segregation and condensation protein B